MATNLNLTMLQGCHYNPGVGREKISAHFILFTIKAGNKYLRNETKLADLFI